MDLDQRGSLLLQNRELVVDAINQVSSWLKQVYNELPMRLHQRPDMQWFKDLRIIQEKESFIQLYRSSWPNEDWVGVHLEITHSQETILEGALHLNLHVERGVRQDKKYWPQLGRLILSKLTGVSIGIGGYVERQVPNHKNSLAHAFIPLYPSEPELLNSISNAISDFKPAVLAVDDALLQCNKDAQQTD